jgi:hypothetical protein
MFNGDIVQLTATGSLIITSTTTPSTSQAAQAAVAGTVGVFLGAEYTPSAGSILGKQRFNYWPAGTVAQDAVGYICDDPDTVFKSAVISQSNAATNTNASTTIGYMSNAFIGTNAYFVSGNSGNTASGNSLAGISGNTAGASSGGGNVRKDNSTTAPFRILGLVQESAVTVQTTGTSSTTTLTVASSAGVLPGMQVIVPGATSGAGNAGANTVVTAVTSATSITISASITAATSGPITFIGYPEVLVKMNFGYHSYYNATQIA